jgi:D-lactate dehydrogenase (cytochrome)
LKIISAENSKFQRDESNYISGRAFDVLIPSNAAEISGLLKQKRKLTVYGAGTGITGGAVASVSGDALSMEKFDSLTIDVVNMTAKAGAAVSLKALQDEASKFGLWYPAESTERSATVGGNIATNAWGTRSFRHGSVRDYIRSITAVLPSGDVIKINRGETRADGLILDFDAGFGRAQFRLMDLASYFSFKNSSGYFMKKDMDLIDLFIGSEGTLGVVTQAEIKLLNRPKGMTAFMAVFDNKNNALNFAAILKAGRVKLPPESIEYFDGGATELLHKKFRKVKPGSHIIFTEFSYDNEDEKDASMMHIDDMLTGPEIGIPDVFVSDSLDKKDFVWQIREAAPQLVNEYVVKKRLRKLATDFAVDDGRAAELMALYENVLAYSGVNRVIFGHIGNNNLHINFLPENDAQYLEAKSAYISLVKGVKALGGTISAEHGVGKTKKDYFAMSLSDEMITAMKNIKKGFDPENLLNPGNIFDL